MPLQYLIFWSQLLRRELLRGVERAAWRIWLERDGWLSAHSGTALTTASFSPEAAVLRGIESGP